MSAALSRKGVPIAYLTRLKQAFTCKPYLILMVCFGYGLGFFYTLSTVTQQILCSVGYSTVWVIIGNVM